MKERTLKEQKEDKILEATYLSEQESFDMLNDDPEWNKEVAKCSKSYAKYSFKKMELEKGKDQKPKTVQIDDDICDIWY